MPRAFVVGLALAFVFVAPRVVAQSEEMPARGPIPFSTYDKNGDGAISQAGFYEVRGKRMSSRAAEGRRMRGAAHAPAFADLDTDGDGQLTPDELAAGQEAQMEKRRRMGMGRGRGGSRGMGPGRNMPSFDEYDLDGDGKVSREEFAAHQTQRRRSEQQE